MNVSFLVAKIYNLKISFYIEMQKSIYANDFYLCIYIIKGCCSSWLIRHWLAWAKFWCYCVISYHKNFQCLQFIGKYKNTLKSKCKKVIVCKNRIWISREGRGCCGGWEYLFNCPIPVLYFGICVYLSFAMFKNCSFFISIWYTLIICILFHRLFKT